MKRGFYRLFAIAAIAIASCSNSENKKEREGGDTISSSKGSTSHTTTSDANEIDANEIKVVPVTFTSLDIKAAMSINEIVEHYLHIKNALAGDNPSEAARSGDAMQKAMRKLDQSLLTADQKAAYDNIESELLEHAGHIADNEDKIRHQRSHFVMMSERMYELVKFFGGGRTLYHAHCPMARNNMGALWISEKKEIGNPYFGAEMLTCGTVEEVIK